MCGTVSIPQREGRVESVAASLHDFILGIAVHAVYVRNLVRLNQGMVEAGIIISLFSVCTCYFDALQVVVPAFLGSQTSGFEIPSRKFGIHVFASTFHAGSRQGNLSEQFVTRLHIEASHDALALFGFCHRQIDLAGSRTVEFQNEEIVLVYPNTVTYVASQGLCVFPLHVAEANLRVVLRFVPSRTMLQVNQDRSRVCSMIGITMESYTWRSGQFSSDIRFFQFDTIITRSCWFLIFRETAAISIPSTSAFASSRHYEYIAKVHTTGSVQVCLGEAPNDRVVIHIFRTISPTHCAGYRTGLNHTERSGSSRECMAVVGCPDEWIHVLGVIHWCCIGLSLVATAG